MSKYDELKKKHAKCKDEMSSRDWKNFAVSGKGKCPVCKKD